MPNLLEIYDYAISSNNQYTLNVVSRYMTNKSNYLLGGMIVLKLEDDITSSIIKEVQSLLYYSEGESMHPEDINTITESIDMKIIINSIEEMRLQKLRMNGLLRAIVFWLSPARKRATEYASKCLSK